MTDFVLQADYDQVVTDTPEGWWHIHEDWACRLITPSANATLWAAPVPPSKTWLPLVLEQGQAILPQSTETAGWFTANGQYLLVRSSDSETTTTNQVSGLMADRTNVLLAVKFEAADGWHVGWIRFGEGAVVEGFDYQPPTDTAIRAGEAPEPPTPEGEEVLTQQPIDLGGGSIIDCVLNRRVKSDVWGNPTSTTVFLTSPRGYQVLQLSTNGDPAAVRYATRLPARTLIPQYPVPPMQWGPATNPVVLLSRSVNSDAGSVAESGPLAGQSEAMIGLKFTGGAGWLRFDGDGNLLGQGYLPNGYPVTGEPTPAPRFQAGVMTLGALDADQDGLVDLVLTLEKGNGIDEYGEWWSEEARVLYVPAETSVLNWSVAPGAPLSGELPAGQQDRTNWTAWALSDLVLHVCWNQLYMSAIPPTGEYGALPYPQWPATLGLRLAGPNGPRAAWVCLDENGIRDFGVQAAPDQPLYAGQQGVLTNPRIKWERLGNALRLSWHPLARDCTLEYASSLGDGPAHWLVHPSTNNAAVMPLDLVGSQPCFFRLKRPASP